MQDMEVSLQIRIYFFNPSSLSLIKFNYNDPPLKFSSRRSWVKKPEHYAFALKFSKVWWQLRQNDARSLDTHDTGRLSWKITHVVTLHQSVKKVPLQKSWSYWDNNCRLMGALEFLLLPKIEGLRSLQQFISDQVTHNHPTHIGPWTCNNSSEIFRKKQSVRCV